VISSKYTGVPAGPNALMPGKDFACQTPIRAAVMSLKMAWTPRSATSIGSTRSVPPCASALSTVPLASADDRYTPQPSGPSVPGTPGTFGMQPATGAPPAKNMK
jgi:hypothetical protein